MAGTAGATTTYDQGPADGNTNREDLSKILWSTTPTDVPLLSAIGRSKATAVSHDWPVEDLKAPKRDPRVEGQVSDPTKRAPRERLSNYCEIYADEAVASGTQEVVAKSGSVGSEVAHNIANIFKELKTDAELAMIGRTGAKAVGDAATVPREMGSLDTYLVGDSYQGTGSAPTGNGVDVPIAGTGRNLDEDIFKSALSDLWAQSGGNKNLLAVCNAKQRGIISTFSSSATRYTELENGTLKTSVDVYDGDFHVVTVMASRQCLATNVFIVDTEYLKWAELRSIKVDQLAKRGDANEKLVTWEGTMAVGSPKAHVNIADLL